MNTKLLALLILLISLSGFSQTTAIPNINFEEALIDLGIDSNGLTGTILNTDALSVTSLDLSSKNISNLTGIGLY